MTVHHDSYDVVTILKSKQRMSNTLKEQFRDKTLNRLQERLRLVDKHVIAELKMTSRATKIYEAFDKQQMAAAIDVVKKLKSINFGGLTALAQARDAAIADVTKVLSGSKSTGLIRRIVDLFSDSKENPLVDALAYSDALKNFFDQFTQYVIALGTDLDDEATLGAIVTGKSAEDVEDLSSVNALEGDAKKKLGDLQNVIIRGLKPSGTLAAVGKNWIDKYLKGKKGLKQLASDIVKMKLKDLKAISENVSSSMKNAEAVGQAAAGAAQQGTLGTTQSTGSEPTQQTGASAGSKSSKPGTVAPGAQVPGTTNDNSSKLAQAVFNDIRSDFDDVDEKTVMSVLQTLASNNKLKQ